MHGWLADAQTTMEIIIIPMLLILMDFSVGCICPVNAKNISFVFCPLKKIRIAAMQTYMLRNYGVGGPCALST